jgi:hypothetical protein
MKCPVVQRYLLRLEHPDRPCQSVRDHLSHCPACRKAHAGLRQLEGEVRHLPVPESNAKAPFVQQFRGAMIGKSPTRERNWLPWQVRDRARRKLALAASLAAGIVLFAIGWAVLHRATNSVKPSAPLTAGARERQKLQHDLNRSLARAHSDTERLDVYSSRLKSLDLQKLAEKSTEEELTEIVGFYRTEFMEGLLKTAADLPAEERKDALISLATQLVAVAVDADNAVPYCEDEAKADQLRILASAARQGASDLRALVA